MELLADAADDMVTICHRWASCSVGDGDPACPPAYPVPSEPAWPAGWPGPMFEAWRTAVGWLLMLWQSLAGAVKG